MTTEEEDEYAITEHDRDPSNVSLRAGYVLGLAARLDLRAEDRTFLLRASRSLRAYAEALRDKERK